MILTAHYMVGEYDYRIVAFSVAIAIFSGYTALDLASRITPAWRRHDFIWLAAGAITIGTGIWCMHFAGMLAFDLPVNVGYDFVLTGVSWGMAVLVPAAGLYAISSRSLSALRLLAGSSLMAAGIVSEYYIGMYALRMDPGIVYDPSLVVASVVFALGSSALAMWLGFNLRSAISVSGILRKLSAALVMGITFAGTNYLSMAAARFPVGSVSEAATQLDADWLTLLVGASATLLLGIALVASILDRRLESQTAGLVESLSKANAELRHLSRHDPLTGMANRTLLIERIDESLERFKRDEHKFCVLYIDLDGFKAINDNLGHQYGDEMLRRAADVMQQSVRQSDTVARIGGDEFVLVIQDIYTPAAVAGICDKLCEVVADVGDSSVPISASVGSAVCPDDGVDASALVAAADVAMYAAKLAGKNGHQRFSIDMSTRVSEEFVIQMDLRMAIQRHELDVHYQPKYTTGDRKLIGAEALVRWPHPKKGMIPPDRFIPVAEQRGLIVELETLVLSRVCSQIRAWLDRGLQVPPIAVNLSTVRMRDEQLPDRVQACLDAHGLDPKYLVLEITESAAIQNIIQAMRTLNRFKEMGVDIALDDFGTGYSSLSYLKQLPIQQLKIDRSFIAELSGNDSDLAQIVRAIMSLAQALRLQVIAEGVETEEQMRHLEGFDCDAVQGYLLGRPISADKFVELIPHGRPTALARQTGASSANL